MLITYLWLWFLDTKMRILTRIYKFTNTDNTFWPTLAHPVKIKYWTEKFNKRNENREGGGAKNLGVWVLSKGGAKIWGAYTPLASPLPTCLFWGRPNLFLNTVHFDLSTQFGADPYLMGPKANIHSLLHKRWNTLPGFHSCIRYPFLTLDIAGGRSENREGRNMVGIICHPVELGHGQSLLLDSLFLFNYFLSSLEVGHWVAQT